MPLGHLARAAGIALAARTRAARLAVPRTAAALLGPTARDLARALARLAEAMEARGYGGPGRTRAPERRLARREWALAVVGATATALVAAAILGGATAFRYYDTLGDPLHPAAVAGAAVLAVLLAAAAGMVRWLR